MNSEDWMQPEIARLTAQHGTVPPPWIAFQDAHPYEIGWRMGAGESYLMVWREWWAQQRFDEAGRIQYFGQWPPPPRSLGWMIQLVWDLDPSCTADDVRSHS